MINNTKFRIYAVYIRIYAAKVQNPTITRTRNVSGDVPPEALQNATETVFKEQHINKRLVYLHLIAVD